MKKLYIDFETRSAVDIKKAGAWKYALDPSTEVMCMAYSFDGEPVRLHTAADIRSRAALMDLSAPDTIVLAHNVHFEYAVFNLILAKRYGWPALWDPQRWDCTLARAAAANLPIHLEGVCSALNLKHQKDLVGRAAMLKLTRPIGEDPLGGHIYREDPDLYQILYAYCAKDVEAEIELDKRLPQLSAAERKIWELDLVINRRGVCADVEMARRAMNLASSITDGLNTKLVELTGGAVDKASRVGAIKNYLTAQGVVGLDSLNKQAVTALLENNAIAPHVKDVIKIRQQVGKSSTAKYQAILDYAAVEKDNRMRGMLQYHAAGTGRWGGRGPQPQNFPKGIGFDSGAVAEDILAAEFNGETSPEIFIMKYGDRAMDALSAALRGALTAGPGKVLVSADYSAIEARVLLWLADDHLALVKYKMGMNLYVDMAKFIYNNDKIDKKSHPLEYAVGKAAVLGCGYGMGKDKFHATCQSWGIDIAPDLAEAAVKAYRNKYKKVVELWYATEAAARSAVRTPGSIHYSCAYRDEAGKPVAVGRVSWAMDKAREFLVATLPSGRAIRYYRPSLRAIITPYGEKEEIHYWAAGLGGKLEETKTYGGSLVENIVQATARDVMANGMLRAEEAGFPVVMTVHDELVAEKTAADDDVKRLEEAMCALPPWANGLPIAAEGWTGFRYRK